MKEEDLIPIGKIVGTHGIHGKLRITYYNEDKTSFLRYRRVLVRDLLGRLEPFEVTEAKIHRKLIIVQLKDVDHIDRANRLVGASVLVERTLLPKLEEGEYYWVDLIGMEVITPTGVQTGRVSGIIPTGSSDVFVITINGKEVLVPATEDVIKRVDVVSRRMVIDLKEDLAGDDTI